MLNKKEIIKLAIVFVKNKLSKNESGHDWWHTNRVYNMAIYLARKEKADLFICQMAALFHDIADPKFHNGDENIGPKITSDFLKKYGVDSYSIIHIIKIISSMSFSKSKDKIDFFSLEFAVVQDADRLDAIGAIGIARAFSYGGYKKSPFYDPEIKPNLKMTKVEYRKNNASVINHFYEKLLLLKDRMNTKSAKKIAKKRHQFMLDFLKQFYSEWQNKILTK